MTSFAFIKTAIATALLLPLGALVYLEQLPSESTGFSPSSFLRTKNTSTTTGTTAAFPDIFPDKDLVQDLFQICKDLYKIDDENYDPKDAISDDKFELVKWITSEFSTEVMILKSDLDETYASKPIIVFRGSEDFNDALVNVQIEREQSRFVNAPDDVFIHRGFQDALFEFNVTEQIEEQVMQMIDEEGEIILSGHSLGGALAHILAVYFADKYPNMKVTMINVGAPRLGNKAFKTWSEELPNLAVWRYVYRKDVVPRLIPTSLGYHHAGHLYQMHKSFGGTYYSMVYYRQTGDGVQYARAPRGWYCKYSIVGA